MVNNKLKAKIVEKFGSQANFAEELDIFATIVSRVVRGRIFLSDEDQIRWANLLDCNPEDIFIFNNKVSA